MRSALGALDRPVTKDYYWTLDLKVYILGHGAGMAPEHLSNID